jgi:hypothetical protein
MFKKYHSIPYIYKSESSWVSNNTRKFEEAREKNENYHVQHKYDGCNLQIIFTKVEVADKLDKLLNGDWDVTVNFASRNKLLGDTDTFNGYKDVVNMPYMREAIENIKKYLLESCCVNGLHLYGELHGPEINRRIKYFEPRDTDKNENRLVFFDVVRVFDPLYKPCYIYELANPEWFYRWAALVKLPVVENFFVGKFNECINFDISGIKTECGDIIEGVVLKPSASVPIEKIVHFKKINPEFYEVRDVKSKKINPEFYGLRVEKNKTKVSNIDEYLEETAITNRIIAVMSKQTYTRENLPQLKKDVVDDLLEDFGAKYPSDEVCKSTVYRAVTKRLVHMI